MFSLSLLFISATVISSANGFKVTNSPHNYIRHLKPLFSTENGPLNDNADMFGGASSSAVDPMPAALAKSALTSSGDKLKDQAINLRRDAEEVDIVLREEARSKGLPKEAIEQLIPLRNKAVKLSASNTETVIVSEVKKKFFASDIR